MTQYGICGTCHTKVALLVLSGRVRHHVRNGKRCDGSLHQPESLKVAK